MSNRFEGNIVLVGFMGAGKSTVGLELEQIGGFRLIDLDRLIVQQAGRSIPEIFDAEGEASFRDYEATALRSLLGVRRAVIATGGGVIGREENWSVMRRLGLIVYLRAAWPTLCGRISGSQERPLASGRDLSAVEKLWRSRLPLYEKADVQIDTDGLDARAVAKVILEHSHRLEANSHA